MPLEFACPVSTTGGRAVICVAGEVDLATAPVLQAAMLAALAAAPVELTVDLDAVSFLDSSGIQALLNGWKRAGADGIPFVIASPPAQVRKVLDITGLTELFAISTETESMCRTSA
jgi:anti-sigma B factor antagonist